MRTSQWLRKARWGACALALMALLISLLDTPPAPPASAQAGTDTPTATPTDTPVSPTDTPTATPTNTPVSPTDTPTSTPTNTPVSPTDTPTATPTDTPVSPTDTPTATPTDTPVAPSATPTTTPTSTPLPSTICPANAASYRRTDVIGSGMGSLTQHANMRQITIPDAQAVASLYGQLAGKQAGAVKHVRFLYPNGTFVQVNTATSPAYRASAEFWYGASLNPAANIRGRWFLQPSGASNHVPRAFILYPTYETADQYVNVFQTFAISSQHHAYWDTANGWIPMQQQTIPLAAPLQAADVMVTVVIVDNDRDTRPFRLTISAGSVSQVVTINGPTHGNLLNLVSVTLNNVPAGTSAIVLNLVSPHQTGDSMSMIGMAAHYECTPYIP